MTTPYDLAPINAPRVAGFWLRVLCVLAESGLFGGIIRGILFKNIGLPAFRDAKIADGPLVAPEFPRVGTLPAQPDIDAPLALPEPAPSVEGFPFETVGDFAKAYRDGTTDPVKVAERVLAATVATNQGVLPLRAIIAQRHDDVLAQAEASKKRFEAGEPLGPLDGVPIAVKDEVDQAGYPTTVGTAFLGRGGPATHDSAGVAKLRAAGAVLIGKANLHEIGLGVTGVNPHHGPARNPYDPTRMTGGSSSGSASAVAAGLCPIALGADGGGSIRIPSSLCGLTGLKATHGRISEHGAAPLCWSMGHIGPLATSATDCAIGYLAMAGRDPSDPWTMFQPRPHLDGFTTDDLSGLTLGIFRPYFEHAEPAIVQACDAAVKRLEAAGAKVVPVEIPDLDLCRLAHAVTITAEMVSGQWEHYDRHHKKYGLDVRLNLALARGMASYDYVQAQRVRASLGRHVAKLLETVDGIVTPTTGCTAPEIPSGAAITQGESNLPLLGQIMRFATLGNLLGLPAITFPVGYDPKGLPIGMQIMGRAWEEHVLLRMARVHERSFDGWKAPKVHHRLLSVGA